MAQVDINVTTWGVIRATKIRYAGRVEQLSPFNENLRLPLVTRAWRIESTPELMALGAEALRKATMIGYLTSFLAVAAIALVALPLVFLAKKRWS